MSITTPHPGMKADPDRAWTTVPELDWFKTQLEAGHVSIFRVGTCKNKRCKNDCPKSKDFCSKACHDTHPVLGEAIVEDVKAALEKKQVDKAEERRREENRRRNWESDYED